MFGLRVLRSRSQCKNIKGKYRSSEENKENNLLKCETWEKCLLREELIILELLHNYSSQPF